MFSSVFSLVDRTHLEALPDELEALSTNTVAFWPKLSGFVEKLINTFTSNSHNLRFSTA